MTLQSSALRTRLIRQILRSPRVMRLSPQIRFLAWAVWDVQDKRHSHRLCYNRLPDYVDAEIEGTLSTWHNSFVHEHLLTCHRCSTDYAELLQVVMLDSRGMLGQNNLPSPDLTFLESPNDE